MSRLALSCLLLLAGCRSPVVLDATEEHGLELRYFAIGEGDAVLIRTASGQSIVYDGGRDRRAMLAALQAAGTQSVDLVIASHSHSDHVGGLSRVLLHFQPPYVIENGLSHSTRRYGEFIAAIEMSGAQRLLPTRRTLLVGDVSLHVVPPPFLPEWGHNDNSIGVIVEYGRFRASLLGDSEATLQDWWLLRYPDVFTRVHVHKASHHGSRKGDTRQMLVRLQPQVVVVSTAAGSQYPHASVVDAYKAVGAKVLRTDLHGTVTIRAARDGSFQVLHASPVVFAPAYGGHSEEEAHWKWSGRVEHAGRSAFLLH